MFTKAQRFLRSSSNQFRTGYSSLIRGLSGQYAPRFWPLEGPDSPSSCSPRMPTLYDALHAAHRSVRLVGHRRYRSATAPMRSS